MHRPVISGFLMAALANNSDPIKAISSRKLSMKREVKSVTLMLSFVRIEICPSAAPIFFVIERGRTSPPSLMFPRMSIPSFSNLNSSRGFLNSKSNDNLAFWS